MPTARVLAASSLFTVVAIAASAVATPAPAAASSCPLSGDGSTATPFLVASAADLAKVSSFADSCAAGATYRQTADITLAGSWTPIGGPFTGTYDGDGFTISGLTVSRAGSNHNGLFGMASTGAVIRDVHLVDASVTGAQYTAAIAGELFGGSIIDSSVQGTVSSSASHTGGLVGIGLGATVSGSSFTGTVTSSAGSYVGGLVGDLGSSGSIVGSTADADVTSADSHTGGLVGIGLGATVSGSSFTGTVSSSSGNFVGGLVGDIGSGSVTDSSAEADVSSAGLFTAGLAGYGQNATVLRSRFVGTVTSTASPGTYVAGLVGDIGSGSVTDSSAQGDVSSRDGYTAGLVGYGQGATVLRSRFVGTVTSTAGVYIGGLVGDIGSGSVTDSSAQGDVSSVGPYSGGVVGSAGSGAAIVRSRFIGTVTASNNLIGGLAGRLGGATLTDSFARADVTSTAGVPFIGGLVGEASGATVTRTYASGSIVPAAGSSLVGGLIGQETSGTVADSFWDTETSAQATSDGGTGKATAELTALATFADTATSGLVAAWPIVDGWAAADVGANRVWGICPRVNDGYPFLLWEYSSDPCVDPVSAAAPSIAIACTGPDGGTLQAGAVASCVLSGADPGIDILWRAAYNPAFAEGPVRTGADGRGTFTFTIPIAAAGSVLTVEPVARTAPIVVGTVEGDAGGGAGAGGPVPARIPAGGGSGTPAVLLVLGASGVLGLVLRSGRRSVRTPG